MKHNHELTLKYSEQVALLFWAAYKQENSYLFQDKLVSHKNKILSNGIPAHDYFHNGYRTCVQMRLNGETSVTWKTKLSIPTSVKEFI